MSDYTQITDFSAKDNLEAGDPDKLIVGSDFDAELSAISTAIATKYDSSDLASEAQAQAGTSNSVLMTPLRVTDYLKAITKIKDADESVTTSTTYQDDDDLGTWSLTAGGVYRFNGFIRHNGGNGDLKMQWVFSQTPQSGGIWWYGMSDDTPPIDTDYGYVDTITDEIVVDDLASAGTANAGTRIAGCFVANASTGGTLKLQWAQNASNATATTLYTGSWITVELLG